MKHARILLAIGLLMTAALISASCASQSAGNGTALGRVTDYRSDGEQTLAKDEPAPNFQLTMPDGKTVFLNDFQGKVVMLNFWGVNCPYCVKEMPYLQKANDELASQGVVILGINTGDPEKSVKNFVNENNITFPIILDPDVYASTLYGARYLPTTILIDRTGNIRSGRIGAYENAEELMTELRGLMQ